MELRHEGWKGTRLLARKVLAVLVSTCMVVAYIPGLAYAGEIVPQDTVTGTVSCGNGWVLAYEAEADDDGAYEATVTGLDASSNGSGALVIPSTVTLDDGTSATVTALAERAFVENATLTDVTLPSTLEAIPARAFQKCSTLTSINIPESAAYIGPYAFWQCTSLESVTFECSTLEFLGYRAFRECTALTELSIPPLCGGSTSYRLTKNGPTADEYRIGYQCFYDCSSLELVSLLPGADGSEYVGESNNEAFSGVASNFKLLIYVSDLVERTGHASESSGIANVKNRYYAVSYYTSQEESEADEYGTAAAYQELYLTGTSLVSALSDPDSVADDLATTSGTLPELADGYVWATDAVTAGSSSSIENCIHLYPVSVSDMTYAYVTITSNLVASGDGDSATTTQTIYIIDGMQDLSGVTVYAFDGTELDESLYTLTYQVSGDGGYTEVSASDAWAEGTYRAYATGVGDYAGTTSAATTFAVTYPSTVLSDYSGTDRSSIIGSASLAVDGAISSTPAFSVVANANSWQDCLIASGLAAVGGGLAVFVEDGDDTNTSNYSYSSLMGSDKIYVVGGEDAVGSSVMTRIKDEMNKNSSDITVEILGSDVANDSDALALAVYEGINKIAEDYGYAWGSTAIVASATQSLASSSLASYAYQASCPVFLTTDAGGLSSRTLSDLQAGVEDGSITKIVVAGPSSYVSDDVYASLEALGVTVQRVGGSSASSYETSLEFAALAQEDLGTSTNGYVVADATDVSYVALGAQYAAVKGYDLVTVASSADVKQVAASMAANTTTAVALIGDFTDIDTALTASAATTTTGLLSNVWYGTYSTAIATGDTIEHAGVLYEVTGAGSVSYAGFAEEALEALEWGAFECDGTTYDPGELEASVVTGNTTLRYVSAELSSIPAGMFAGCTALEGVDIVTSSIGASAFAGCTALASITTAATSIGASAFSGCTALASAKLTATGLKSIPASCFSGCTKLASVTIASTALTSVGSKAFYGCKKLKSISLKSSKLTSIGASAFAGCSAMTKATVSSKKLKTIGASAFNGCSKLATVTLASTALTSVGAKAFYGCKKLKSLNLKSTKLKTIGASAFQGCSAMTKLTVSSTALTKVGAKALYGCKKLKTLTLKSKKLKSVGKNALKGTTKSLTVKVPKAKVKKYKKLLQKKGLNKKAKVKAA